MLVTDALVFIAVCLAIIAAVGVRIALSLKDIGASLDRVSAALSASGRFSPATAPERPAVEESASPTESEIAAVIGIAARYAAQSKREGTEALRASVSKG
jgi:hypothetical protein